MGKMYSQREFIAIARKKGWTVTIARGKGSHVWCSKAGERPFPIPSKIKTGMSADVKKRLGIED